MEKTLDRSEQKQIIAVLWKKYCYRDKQGIKSDRAKIINDFEKETGISLSLNRLKKLLREIDTESLYLDSEQREKAETRYNNDGSITSSIRKRMLEKRVFTNQELLELHGINPKENKIRTIISNEWSMTNKDGETFYNFQSKIVAEPIKDGELTIEEFTKLIKQEPKPIKPKLIGVGLRNLVIGLADLHFPMNKEQMDTLLSEMFEIIENGYDTIVIEQLGDLFESSQMKETVTLRGTILPTVDMVEAWSNAKYFYHNLINHCVKYCKKIQIEHACGNHSGNLEYPFLDAIKDKFEEYGNVEVNVHNDWYTAYKIGNVGIILAHGDNVKLKDLLSLFSTEYRVLWGSCETTEGHTGHKHNNFSTTDQDGNFMEQFPTPKVAGEYEDRYGYRSRKFVKLIEYDQDSRKGTYNIG